MATLVTASGCSAFGSDEPADLQVYSARHYGAEEVFAQFTEDTGITVDFLAGDDAELLQRIRAEGEESPADVYMTVDAGNLWAAADQGVLAAVDSPVLDEAVPKQYRDSQDRWFGLVMRARTVIYNPDNVDPSELDTEDTYAGLADPTWDGRLCMRGTTGVYTASLVASLIDLHGREKALEIVEGWVANDVRIESNDVLLIDAVDAGTCDVALVNHYYLARELEERPDLDVELMWASQDGAGTHVNVSGAGVVESSDNPEDAQALMEWLATDGQDDLVAGNQEFPVNADVPAEDIASGFGDFDPMPIDAEAYGSLNAEAIDLLAEAGYQ
ncbi:extracellular solute-binding protein [Nocardioides sp. MJB4]|uniref:Extracellular solute-binding protein n=2 Tax=Nocardioides donggukensis TaxID=2774019 RepID=A0A927K597_9ACTN|nr:extracellular solute-binding protein [Nocardioides donggukensis]